MRLTTARSLFVLAALVIVDYRSLGPARRWIMSGCSGTCKSCDQRFGLPISAS